MQGFYVEVIGSRSFASIWYWIVFAVVWTRATHWTLGVPYEDARNSQRFGGQHQIDFEVKIEINIRKTLELFENHSAVFTAAAAFCLATVFTLGQLSADIPPQYCLGFVDPSGAGFARRPRHRRTPCARLYLASPRKTGHRRCCHFLRRLLGRFPNLVLALRWDILTGACPQDKARLNARHGTTI
jgi:hypothetical protein